MKTAMKEPNLKHDLLLYSQNPPLGRIRPKKKFKQLYKYMEGVNKDNDQLVAEFLRLDFTRFMKLRDNPNSPVYKIVQFVKEQPYSFFSSVIAVSYIKDGDTYGAHYVVGYNERRNLIKDKRSRNNCVVLINSEETVRCTINKFHQYCKKPRDTILLAKQLDPQRLAGLKPYQDEIEIPQNVDYSNEVQVRMRFATINQTDPIHDSTPLDKIKTDYSLASYTASNTTVDINKKEETTEVTKFLSPPQQCALTAHFIVSKPHTYTVLVIGSSDAGKSNFRKGINHMERRRADCNDFDEIEIHDFDDCVVDYDTHSIRYIYKDKLGIEEYAIHGIMLVIENNTLELSNTADNQIRDTFSRLPRCAVKNCCIVNAFESTETFGLIDAQQQMREFVETFRNQHALPDLPSFVCVDTVAVTNLVTDNSNVSDESFESSKRGIKQFLETIQAVQPITPPELKAADNWKSLCVAFRPHYQKRDPETLRLMATIAENCLTGVAIYCRKSLPLRDNEWPGAVKHWSSKDEKVAVALRDLQQ